MNLPVALDVAIGLIVLYLILSTACSFAVELLGNWFWWRKRMLYETIARLLTGDSGCKAPWRPFFREYLLTIFRLRDATRPVGYPAVPPLTELRWGIEKWHNFRRELQSTLKDHSMEGYVRVLKRQI